MELLSTLGINWQLMIAQLVNFGILMAVLTYFLYKPLLNVIDTRRERIKRSMDDAKALEEERRKMEQWKLEQMRTMDQQMHARVEEGKHQAEKVRREILDGAHREAAAFVEKAKKQLQDERTAMVGDLQEHLSRLVVKLSEKVIEREFSPADQQKMLGSLEKAIPSLLR